MDYYIITGTSKGLGKALTELLLEDSNNFVYGIARNSNITHDNYCHFKMDLNNLEEVSNFNFPTLENIDKICLINNAGIVGDINHIGKVDNQKIIDCFNINLISPAILSNNFIKKYKEGEKLIINISSGAGRTPIDGWNTYCSSKAGLDMFSEVIAQESEIDGLKTTVLSLAPGIIDTNMQTEIRSSQKDGFSNLDRFKDYKKNGDLTKPNETAKQILKFINSKELQQNVICSVRDLTN